MNILAIETATTACAAGLLSGEHVMSRVLDTERRHTEVLTAGIEQLLADAGLTASDLHRVVVDRGPGLFTGLRVGLATAQALAHGLGIDLVGVTSLELLAHSAMQQGVTGTMCALVDGRRGEVFAQNFALSDVVVALDEPVVTTALQLSERWSMSHQAITISGDGAHRFSSIFTVNPRLTILADTVPSIEAALMIGVTRLASDHVSPLYLRDADAVANFTTRLAGK